MENVSSFFCLPVVKRDNGIDLLRFIALIGVIIAHCRPLEFLLQLRQFDVPLMVILAAVSFSMSNNRKQESWFDYCVKRAKRLILPTWIFLTMYFLLFKEDDTIVVITSYLLIWGIGYVWIIRVFFVVAVFAPFLHRLTNSFASSVKFWLFISFLLCCSEFLITLFQNQINSSFIVKAIFVTLPYLIVYMVGLRIAYIEKKEILIAMLCFFVVYIAQSLYLVSISQELISNDLYKYPPRLYYISYALAAGLLLFALKDWMLNFLSRLSTRLCDIICWVGQHTLWVYLWHIVFIALCDDTTSSVVSFFWVTFGAAFCTYVQCLILKFLYRYINNDSVKKNLRIIFEG